MTETLWNTDFGTQYADPVGRLLTIGETRSYDPAKWPDYVVNLGLARVHVAALACMICDAALNRADRDSSEVWAPMHAWRALGQLGLEDAFAPLLVFLRTSENDDAVGQGLPVVFGMIGHSAVPPHVGPLGWLDQPDAGGIQHNTRVSPQDGKVGRNDPCPCGSEKNYKKCCLQ